MRKGLVKQVREESEYLIALMREHGTDIAQIMAKHHMRVVLTVLPLLLRYARWTIFLLCLLIGMLITMCLA